MSNAIIAEVREAAVKTQSQSERNVIMRVVSGKIVKKYKCLDTVRKQTGLGRKGLKASHTKEVRPVMRKRLEKERNKLRQEVIQFLERDDISIQMPGKKDSKTHEGEKRQVRVLNDYLGNIFQKYKAENPHVKISKTVFSRFMQTWTSLKTSHVGIWMRYKVPIRTLLQLHFTQ